MNAIVMDLFPAPTWPWENVRRDDVRVRELADRHYSRQTIGAKDFMGPGRTFVLLAEFCSRLPEANGTRAGWGVNDNLDPIGERRFRCTIFRNETPWLSSFLIKAATTATLERWQRRYGWNGSPPLRTEVDPSKTRRKRDPGRCFIKAGWRRVGEVNGLIVLEAPS